MTAADAKSLPDVDGVAYRLVINDSVRAIELKALSIDLTDQLSPADVPGIKADSQRELIESRSFGNSRRLMCHTRGGPFADNLKRRQAVLYSMDRQAVATTLGQGDPSSTDKASGTRSQCPVGSLS